MQGPHPQPSVSHPEQVTARSLPLSPAAGREASLHRPCLQQRAAQVAVALKEGSGRSMPGEAGAGAKLGNARLGWPWSCPD